MAIYKHMAITPNTGRLKPGRIPPYDVLVKRAIQDLRLKHGVSPKSMVRHILKNNLHAKKYAVIKHIPHCLKRMLRAKVIDKNKDNKYKLTKKGRCIIKYCPGEKWKRPYSAAWRKYPKKRTCKAGDSMPWCPKPYDSDDELCERCPKSKKAMRMRGELPEIEEPKQK